VGFSRVYLGVHFPTDVLAGAIVGIIAGWIVSYADKKIGGQKF
ncbi:MAG: phosphatase PAP2 family protein, partial [Candidatus Omnitrophica bacterium]|nr:phosphatase PAP2 family protein [Candidatus Omnitrophota bacterium]